MSELLSGQLAIWGLTFARCIAAIAMVPPFGYRGIPVSFRLGAAAAISVPLAMVAGGEIRQPLTALQLIELIGCNVFIGLLIGGCVATVFWGAYIAGRYIDGAGGWRTSGVMPQGAELTNLLAAVLFVLMNGHHAIIAALAESLECVPLLDAAGTEWVLEGVLVLPAKMFVASVLIGAPALLSLLLARLLLCIVERLYSDVARARIGDTAPAILGILCFSASLPAVAYLCISQLRYCLDALAVMFQ